MENANIDHHLNVYNQETTEHKHCWFCFRCNHDEDDENNSDWISPCRCRDYLRWVHRKCVKIWICKEIRKTHSDEIHCPLCHTPYIIVYEVNRISWLLNAFDNIANRVSFYMIGGVIAIALYWSAVSYGAITIIQVMGVREAIQFMQNTNSYVLLLVLPSIPVGMILVELFNWEEILLLFVQRFTSKLPLLRTIMPSFLCEPVNNSTSTDQLNSVIDILPTAFCAALVLPTTATVVGNLFFYNSSYSCLQKTLLGGLVYIAVKGVFRIYRSKSNVMNKKTRRVIRCPETNAEENN